jgi:hypothetical protein
MSNPIACPHCGSASAPNSQFCEICGKALPSETATGPHVVGADEIARTGLGQQLQGEELQREIKKASSALLWVAILQTAASLFVFIVQQAAQKIPHPLMPGLENLLTGVAIAMFAFAIIYWVLYSWSQTAPLPAAIVGLVIYGTQVGINIFITLSHAAQTGSNSHSGFSGIGVGWLDIVIIALVCRGIRAGITYRKLRRQEAENALVQGEVAAASPAAV